MGIKDHYRTLGITSHASAQEVKKAYRSLAHQYHPDKNPDSLFAAARFREVQEAYSILSDDKKRKLYDEERYFAGLSSAKEPATITPAWLLKQAKKLSAHMQQVDSHRMNHKALHDYIMLLLSDAHIAVLQADHNPAIVRELVGEILYSIRGLHFTWFSPVAQRLRSITADDEALQQAIHNAAELRRRSTNSEKYLPLVVAIVTLLLCFIMFLYSRR